MEILINIVRATSLLTHPYKRPGKKSCRAFYFRDLQSPPPAHLPAWNIVLLFFSGNEHIIHTQKVHDDSLLKKECRN